MIGKVFVKRVGGYDPDKPRVSANKLTADLLIEIPKTYPQVRIWRSNRLNAMAVGRGGKLRRVSAGVDGQGDISGIATVRVVVRGEEL